MSSQHAFSITKPVLAWNKPLKANFKDLFKSLGKAVIDGTTGKWENALKDLGDAAVSLGLKEDSAQIAWQLVYNAITQAVYTLIDEHKESFLDPPSAEALDMLCDDLDWTLEQSELCIDRGLFERPKELAVVEAIKTPFSQWLTKGFELNEAQALSMTNRLPSYFVFALNAQWRESPQRYERLKEAVETPFTTASQREQGWLHYRAWLQKQVDEQVFGETFSLKQVYISLRAYYKKKEEKSARFKLTEQSFKTLRDENIPEDLLENLKPLENKDFIDKEKFLEAVKKQIEEEQTVRYEELILKSGDQYRRGTERIVIDLEQALIEWLRGKAEDDALRVICGGPGCGKSSFAKMFAAHLAERSDLPVLFIPLHQLELTDDIIEAVGDFVQYEPFFNENPLHPDPHKGEARLLMIFDGLDELAMQGKVGQENAQYFIREVQRQLSSFNRYTTRLQVLISGRDAAIPDEREFHKPGQILHVLPYFLKEEEQEGYRDPQGLLPADQRRQWWQNYGNVSGKDYAEMPEELSQPTLDEITTQPLLNYLVALSYTRGNITFSQATNLNEIYADLLQAVYERGWAGHRHAAVKDLSEDLFIRVLEEIAVAAWHGEGRVTTVREVQEHCEQSGLKPLLDTFTQGVKQGLSRLFLAFYFRPSERRQGGDETFEFTHKIFGEYLTARRIVRGVRHMHDELQRRQETFDSGMNERDALIFWAKLCGPTRMETYLFRFVQDEMRLKPTKSVLGWQHTLCRLIECMLEVGMPMEALQLKSYRQEATWASHAEEALWTVLNSCERCTQEQSAAWNTSDVLREWRSKLLGNIYALRDNATNLMHEDIMNSTKITFIGVSQSTLRKYLMEILNRAKNNNQKLPWTKISVYFVSNEFGKIWGTWENYDFEKRLLETRNDLLNFFGSSELDEVAPNFNKASLFQVKLPLFVGGCACKYEKTLNDYSVVYLVFPLPYQDLKQSFTIRVEDCDKKYPFLYGQFLSIIKEIETKYPFTLMGEFKDNVWNKSVIEWAAFEKKYSIYIRSMRELVEFAEIEPSHKVLDVGCSTGKTSKVIAEHLKGDEDGKLTLLDAVPHMIQKARQNLRDFSHIEYLIGEVYKTAGFVLRGKKFDRIIFHFSFPYMFPTLGLEDLDFWKRYLEKKGEIVIAIHNSFINCKMPEEWRNWKDPFREEIEKQIQERGLSCKPAIDKWEEKEINEMFSRGGYKYVNGHECQFERTMADRHMMWQVPSVNDSLFPPEIDSAERNEIIESAYSKCGKEKTAPTIVKYFRFTPI